MPTIMPIYGTRPEAIKVAPIVKALQADDRFDCVVTVTGQHREMLDQVNELFLLACVLAGAGTGTLNSPQQAAVADVVGQGRRSGAVMSTAQMAGDLGAIAGPLLAGMVVDAAGFEWAFMLTGGVLLLGALAWVWAPETNLPIAPGGPRTGSLPRIIPPEEHPGRIVE